jgi:hypothetical protein
MTDYQPLIARAVEGLANGTGEARRALYERARTALVTQLRGAEPPLSEAEITKERLALEEAIRKVEADAARKLRTEPRPPVRAEPAQRPAPPQPTPPRRERPVTPPEPPRTPRAPEPSRPQMDGAELSARPPQTARERLLGSRQQSPTQEGLKGFRDVVSEVRDLGGATAKAVRSARTTRDNYGSAPEPYAAPSAPQEEALGAYDGYHPQADGEADYAEEEARLLRGGLEPSHDYEDEQEDAFAGHQAPHGHGAAEAFEEARPPRSYAGLIRLAVVGVIILGVIAAVWSQWSSITGAYHLFARGKPAVQTTQETPTTQPKFDGRVPQEQSAAQAPSTGTAPSDAGPAVAQRVVLYEEDPNDPAGKRYVGSAVWRTETVSPGAGLAPELAVRADITIPDRRMTVTWSLRRNTDKTLPASHTIEIMFTLPADFPGGGIGNVPGVLMKQAEQARGTPLAGLAVKVTNGFFLIGLSAVDADMQRNIQLLKERPWFDIPLVYTNGGRAILAMEKGPPGDRAFADAFAAWEKK